MTANKPGDPTTLNRLYGRAKGKKLRLGQAELVETLLPQIAVPEDGPITAERLFGWDRPLHFEIGFGGGEHMAFRADLLPDHGFIGCEPFLNGVAIALGHIRDAHLGNVRVHMGDALEVLARVPDGTLSFIYLLHPDPWPKARHAKRRMMNDGPVNLFAAKLKPGGELRFGTDHPIYLRHALMSCGAMPTASNGWPTSPPISRIVPAAGPRPVTRPRRASTATRSGTSAIASDETVGRFQSLAIMESSKRLLA